MPGAESVPGTAPLLAAGFIPVETLTGMVRIGEVWPEEHRRSVPETRGWWLEDTSLGSSHGLVWLVRSPWPAISVADVLSIVWNRVEREEPPVQSDDLLLSHAWAVLRMPESEARQLLD